MSKELYVLELLKSLPKVLSIGCQTTMGCFYSKEFKIIEKSLKALEIIKKYKWEINLNWLRFCVFANEEYEFYIESCKQDKHKYITKEEYDLLKEILYAQEEENRT